MCKGRGEAGYGHGRSQAAEEIPQGPGTHLRRPAEQFDLLLGGQRSQGLPNCALGSRLHSLLIHAQPLEKGSEAGKIRRCSPRTDGGQE